MPSDATILNRLWKMPNRPTINKIKITEIRKLKTIHILLKAWP